MQINQCNTPYCKLNDKNYMINTIDAEQDFDEI